MFKIVPGSWIQFRFWHVKCSGVWNYHRLIWGKGLPVFQATVLVYHTTATVHHANAEVLYDRAKMYLALWGPSWGNWVPPSATHPQRRLIWTFHPTTLEHGTSPTWNLPAGAGYESPDQLCIDWLFPIPQSGSIVPDRMEQLWHHCSCKLSGPFVSEATSAATLCRKK